MKMREALLDCGREAAALALSPECGILQEGVNRKQ
jgi:hypothetical protein